MSRKEEYRTLLTELESTPQELKSTVQKALDREKTLQKKKRRITGFFGGMAACFTAFVLLVNFSVPFARACGSVPLLSALARAVSWSPSLTAAVENEYVQPMGLVQTQNGIAARVEYLIVDRKEVDIFFSLSSQDHEYLDIGYPEIILPEGKDGVSSSASTYALERDTLRSMQVYFMERDVSDRMTLRFSVYESDYGKSPHGTPVQEGDYGDELLSEVRQDDHGAALAEFTFELEFDPNFTAQGEVITANETFVLDGQRVTLTEAEVYPTHLRLNFDYDPDNTAWLTGLNFYLENEHGERFEGIANGISGVGSPDTPATSSVWLDSPFFSQGEHLTLHITGATWLDKGRERICVDLANGVIEHPPQGVTLDWAEKRDDGWLVSFQGTKRWDRDTLYQIWGGSFYDEYGNAHDIDRYSVTNSPMVLGPISGVELEAHEERERQAAEEGLYFETFGLKDYTADTVWLEPRWTSITDSTAEVRIK